MDMTFFVSFLILKYHLSTIHINGFFIAQIVCVLSQRFDLVSIIFIKKKNMIDLMIPKISWDPLDNKFETSNQHLKSTHKGFILIIS